MAQGAPAGEIDRFILTRGAIIALLDPTIVSIGSGRLTFQVLFAIGVAMMCMAALRRLPWPALLALGVGWFAGGEWITGLVWHPPGSASITASLLVATYGGDAAVIKYPVIPWLAMMALGWAFGKHISRTAAGQTRFTTERVLAVGGGHPARRLRRRPLERRLRRHVPAPRRRLAGSSGCTSASTRRR